MRQDFRYAFRTLRRSPGFTAATVVTLALAIGGNSAIFSIVNAVLLKPLPIDPGRRLVSVYTVAPQGQRQYVTQPDLDDWRSMAHSFTGFASWVTQSVNMTGGDRPQRVFGVFVSADFLPLLGVSPALGRGFAPGEDRVGGARVAVLSNGLWRDRFAADPAILGKHAEFNGDPYTVIGVLPPDFAFPYSDADVLLPAFQYPNYSLDRGRTSCAVIGKLRDGVSFASAQAEMDAIAGRLAAAYPATNRGRAASVVALGEDLAENLKPAVLAVAVAVGFVLLIGCANAAGLMIARMASRERERAIRVALGAGRRDLFSHVLAEAVLLAAAGGSVGMLLAMWAVPAIAASLVVFLPDGIKVELDRAALLFTFAVSAAAALLVAAIPAWQSGAVKGLYGARGAGAGARRNRARAVLVAGQIALASVLLAGAGLMIRTVAGMGRAQTGFDPRQMLTLAYRVPRNKYPEGAQQARFHREVVQQIRALPGVLGATSVRALPLGGNGSIDDFLIAGRPEPPAAERPRALLNFADPNFFATMRIPLLRGRAFTDQDQEGTPPVVVINQSLARRYFPDRDPIGQHLRLPSLGKAAEIVGVVGDIKQFNVQDQPGPQIYGALDQNPFLFTSVAVRTAGDPLRLADAVRRAIWQVDREQPVWAVESYDELLAAHSRLRRMVMAALSAYGCMAVLLAAIGIFGLVSYAVSQRTGEIGVRMALGAQRADVVKLILRQGISLVLTGIGIGAAAAAWLSRYLASQLYGVRPVDPAIYGTVAALLLAVALAASLLPVRRALRVDPVQALRQE